MENEETHTSTEVGAVDTSPSPDVGASGSAADDDPLADFRHSGGVTHAEYAQAETMRLPNGDEISTIALAAAGTRVEGRELSDGERLDIAQKIDTAVRQNAAWLDSRPLIEQVRGMTAPVIFVGPAPEPVAK